MKSFILLITGPAGAGKTTIGTALSKEIPNTAHIDADSVKHFLVNQTLYDNKTKAGNSQWHLLGNNLGALAKNFAADGFNVIINGYVNIEALEKLFNHVNISHRILLLPHVKTLIYRDSMRGEDEFIGRHEITRQYNHFNEHEFFDDWYIIDSTIHRTTDTKNQIKKYLNGK